MTHKKKRYKTRVRSGKKWSADVTAHSHALDLQSKIFAGNDPHEIALSLKRSASKSYRRKGTPYQSAMSMLNFYINRAGKNLSAAQKHTLKKAKDELKIVSIVNNALPVAQ
jgi:hypothetical protein